MSKRVTMINPVPLEEMLRATAVSRQACIGLPASQSMLDHRFPLTPEGAGMLVARGLRVKMERGAASHIHYTDAAYSRCGVEIVERAEAFACDIVIYLPDMSPADARLLKRGALLLTFMHARAENADTARVWLNRHVIVLALELICDDAGNRPFADILHEIDGCAAITVATSLLADAIHGKGILLGGVAGVVPCEVMIVGADMAGVAAARTAMGNGAIVRMFDNNVYRLRDALHKLGPGVIGSSLHPRVFDSSMSSADIIVVTSLPSENSVVGIDRVDIMKRGVICFDLTAEPGSAFPSMQVIDLDLASAADNDGNAPARLCYINAGNTVPRTVAMALSNTFTTMLDDIMVCDGVANALKIKPGLRSSALCFLGKCVNRQLAAVLGIRPVDIDIYIQLS